MSDLKERFDRERKEHPALMYMKGNALFPKCGYSAQALALLQSYGEKVHAVDVLVEPGVRDGIKAYTGFPTIPQIFLRGEFIGGLDILMQMHEAGELKAKLGTSAPESTKPA
ncbi:MAG: glutaredoxin family protein [Myxococcaceae bacterium]